MLGHKEVECHFKDHIHLVLKQIWNVKLNIEVYLRINVIEVGHFGALEGRKGIRSSKMFCVPFLMMALSKMIIIVTF